MRLKYYIVMLILCSSMLTAQNEPTQLPIRIGQTDYLISGDSPATPLSGYYYLNFGNGFHSGWQWAAGQVMSEVLQMDIIHTVYITGMLSSRRLANDPNKWYGYSDWWVEPTYKLLGEPDVSVSSPTYTSSNLYPNNNHDNTNLFNDLIPMNCYGVINHHAFSPNGWDFTYITGCLTYAQTMQYEPVIQIDPAPNGSPWFNYDATIVNQTNSVFGFKYINPSASINRSSNGLLTCTTASFPLASPSNPIKILGDVWPQDQYKYLGDRTSSTTFSYPPNVIEVKGDTINAKFLNLTIKMKRTGLGDNVISGDQVCKLKLTYNGSPSNIIVFRYVPDELASAIETNTSRGKLRKFKDIDPGKLGIRANEIIITKSMLPPGTNNEFITITAMCELTGFALISPHQYYENPMLILGGHRIGDDISINYGHGNPITTLDIEVDYLGNSDIVLDWIRLETPFAQSIQRGDFDEYAKYHLQTSLNHFLDPPTSNTLRGKNFKPARYYVMDEPGIGDQRAALWGTVRYLGQLLGDIFATEIGSEPQQYYDYLKFADRWVATKKAISQQSIPFLRKGCKDGNEDPSNPPYKYFGFTNGLFSKGSSSLPTQDERIKSSTYETMLYDCEYTDLIPPYTHTLPDKFNNRKNGLLNNSESFQYIDEGFDDSAFYNPKLSYLFDKSVPWKAQINFDAPMSSFNFLPPNVVPPGVNDSLMYSYQSPGQGRYLTGEELRNFLYTNITIGTKGLIFDGEISSIGNGNQDYVRLYGNGKGSTIKQVGLGNFRLHVGDWYDYLKGYNVTYALSHQWDYIKGKAVPNAYITDDEGDFIKLYNYISVFDKGDHLYYDLSQKSPNGYSNVLQTNTVTKGDHIFNGRMSMRSEIKKMMDYVRHNEATIMNLDLVAALRKGYTSKYVQDPTLYSSSYDYATNTNVALNNYIMSSAIQTRPFNRVWNSPPVPYYEQEGLEGTEPIDSGFYQITVLKEKSSSPDIFYLGVVNKRSDPTILEEDINQLKNSSGPLNGQVLSGFQKSLIPSDNPSGSTNISRFLSTAELEELIDNPQCNVFKPALQSLIWKRLGCREIVIPLNITNSATCSYLKVEEVGGDLFNYDNTQVLDPNEPTGHRDMNQVEREAKWWWRAPEYHDYISVIAENTDELRVKLQPGEGKILKVTKINNKDDIIIDGNQTLVLKSCSKIVDCDFDESTNFQKKDPNGNYIKLNRLVRIKSGSKLIIEKDARVSVLAKILVESGAELIIEKNAYLRLNEFGVTWGGKFTMMEGSHLNLNRDNITKNTVYGKSYVEGEFIINGSADNKVKITSICSTWSCSVINESTLNEVSVIVLSPCSKYTGNHVQYPNVNLVDNRVLCLGPPYISSDYNTHSFIRVKNEEDDIYSSGPMLKIIANGRDVNISNCSFSGPSSTYTGLRNNKPFYGRGIDIEGATNISINSSTFSNLSIGVVSHNNGNVEAHDNVFSSGSVGVYDDGSSNFYCSNTFTDLNYGVFLSAPKTGKFYRNKFDFNRISFANYWGDRQFLLGNRFNEYERAVYSHGGKISLGPEYVDEACVFDIGRNIFNVDVNPAMNLFLTPLRSDLEFHQDTTVYIACGANDWSAHSDYHLMGDSTTMNVAYNKYNPNAFPRYYKMIPTFLQNLDYSQTTDSTCNAYCASPLPLFYHQDACYDSAYHLRIPWDEIDPNSPELLALVNHILTVLSDPDIITCECRMQKLFEAVKYASLGDSLRWVFDSLLANVRLYQCDSLDYRLRLLKGEIFERVESLNSAMVLYNDLLQENLTPEQTALVVWRLNRLAIAVADTSNLAKIDSLTQVYFSKIIVDLEMFPMFKDIIHNSGPTAVIENQSGLWLGQNIPNPFKEETEIQFSLPVECKAKITITDLMGNIIAIPVDKVLPAGRNKVIFKTVNLANGTYFYRLESCGKVLSKQLQIIR